MGFKTDALKILTGSILLVFLFSLPAVAFFDDFGTTGFFDDVGVNGFDSDTGFDGFASDTGGSGFFDDVGGSGSFDSGGFGDGVGFTPIGDAFDDFDPDFTPFDDFPGTPDPENVPPFEPDEIPVPNPGPGPSSTPTSTPAVKSADIVLKIESTRFPFETYPGEVVPFYLTVKNEGSENLDNTKIVIVEQDLALRASAGPFDLNRGDREQRVLIVDVPASTEPGIYSLRFTVTSNSITKRVVYRELEVLPLE